MERFELIDARHPILEETLNADFRNADAELKNKDQKPKPKTKLCQIVSN